MREHPNPPCTLFPVCVLPLLSPFHHSHFFNRIFYSSLPVIFKPLLSTTVDSLMLGLLTSLSHWRGWFLSCDTLFSPGLWDATALGVGISISVHAHWLCLFFLCFWMLAFSRVELLTSLSLCRHYPDQSSSVNLGFSHWARLACSSVSIGPSLCLLLGSSAQHLNTYHAPNWSHLTASFGLPPPFPLSKNATATYAVLKTLRRLHVPLFLLFLPNRFVTTLHPSFLPPSHGTGLLQRDSLPAQCCWHLTHLCPPSSVISVCSSQLSLDRASV